MSLDPRRFVGRERVGEFTVEPWQSHLWADATSSPEDGYRQSADDPAVPPSLIVHLAREATGMEAVETELRADAGPDLNVFLGGQGITVHRPLRVDTAYRARAVVEPVDEKSGESGEFTVLTVAYDAVQDDGETAFEAYTDLIVRGTEGEA